MTKVELLHVLMRQIGQDTVDHPKIVQSLLAHKAGRGEVTKGKAWNPEANMGIRELEKQKYKADTPGSSNTEKCKIEIRRTTARKITQRPEGFRSPHGVQ